MAQTKEFRGVARSILRGSDATRYIYHTTAVVTVHRDGSIMLDTGGWRTATTKTAMNQASNEAGLGFRVFAREGDWFVSYLGRERAYTGRLLSLAPNATEIAEAGRALA